MHEQCDEAMFAFEFQRVMQRRAQLLCQRAHYVI